MHPATRLRGDARREPAEVGARLPALASVAHVGGSRPGAQILAVALTAGGTPQPLIAAQRYGQGRSVAFAGEASWRWRMMRPATDTSYETIWRPARALGHRRRAGPGHDRRDEPAVARHHRSHQRGRARRGLQAGRQCRSGDRVTTRRTARSGRCPRRCRAPQDGRYGVATRFDQQGVYKIDVVATRGGTRSARPRGRCSSAAWIWK